MYGIKDVRQTLVPVPSSSEVESVIQKLKKYKSPDTDKRW
jgi:hypothetical protein